MDKLTLTSEYRKDYNHYIVQQIKEETAESIGRKLAYQNIPVAFYLEDEQGNLRGGIVAHIAWGIIFVEQLWIHKNWRRHKYGRLLMDKVQDFARTHKCSLLILQTVIDEARPFYEKTDCSQLNDLQLNIPIEVFIKKIT